MLCRIIPYNPLLYCFEYSYYILNVSNVFKQFVKTKNSIKSFPLSTIMPNFADW